MGLNSPSPAWPGVIRPHADPGLATCLQDRQICKDGYALSVSRLDVEAVCLAEWAVARRRLLVLCPPDPLAPLAELVAAAIHVADMAQQYRVSHEAMGSRRRVAIVTSDFHSRGLYRGLGVRNPHGGIAPLRDVVPAATLGGDGVVRVLGRDAGRGWSTVFVTSVAEIKKVGKIDLAVVDLASSGVGPLLDLGIPVVAIARDPADPKLLRLPGTALTVGWSRADMENIRDDAGLPPRLARRARGERCEVIAVPAQAVCENAALFWQDIGPLVRAASASRVGGELARESFALFHDLLGLALPMSTYEEVTAPIRTRLDAIGSAARLTHGETRDLYLPMVEAELRDLARALGALPPKHGTLIRTLGRLLDEHKDVMLVARTAEFARLHASALKDTKALARVRVVSLGSLPDEAPADIAVLTGMAPTWARWIYRAGIADALVVLAYTPETPVTIADGFDEVELVRRVVDDQRAREAWFGRAAAKDMAWSELSGEPRRIQGDETQRPSSTGNTSGVEVVFAAPAEVPPGLWDGTGWLAPLEPTGAMSAATAEGTMGAPPHAVVIAVKVTFEDGRWALMDKSATVTRFGPGSGSAYPAYEVGKLKAGDQVLFLDRDSRKDLLAKVLEVAGVVPALAVAAGWVAYWRRVLLGGYRQFGSYTAFSTGLREHGCTVQPQTVRLWVIGETIGPEDDADVHRVGIVTGDAVLLNQHREVCRAVRALRGAHHSLGRRLSQMARHVGSAAAAGLIDGDELVDERSGLTAADFQESVDILTVSAIETVGDVPYLVVGRLNNVEKTFDQEYGK